VRAKKILELGEHLASTQTSNDAYMPILPMASHLLI